jgi:trehalose-6-phosphate synthase
MEPEERRARRTACEAVVRQNDIGKWIRAQLADLRQLRQNA